MGKKKRRYQQRPLVSPTASSGWNFLMPYRDGLIYLAILVFSLLIWWPTRDLPYHWDSAGFVINAARQLLATNFSPFIAEFSDFAHPPLLIALLALAWKVFGQSFLVSHLLMFPFLPLLLVSTYALGKRLANWRVGLGAAVLVACAPFILGEYGLIYVDLPTGALATLALWLWFEHKPWWSMVILTAVVGIKLPLLVILLPLTLHTFRDPVRGRKLKSYLPFLLPPIAAVVWLIYHYQITGWLLARPERPSAVTKSITEFWNSGLFVLDRLFFKQYRWLMMLAGLGSAIYLNYHNRLKWTADWITIGLILGVGLLFFIIMGEFGLRYGIFLMPPFALLTSYWVDQAIPNRIGKGAVLGVLIIFLSLAWHPTLPLTDRYEFRFSEDLSYQDMIKIGQGAAQFVEQNYPQAQVFGSFPENYQLTQPFQGYVRQPVELQDCKKFQLVTDRTQLIYVHPYSPFQQYCRQLIDAVPVQQLKRFESNGKWIELYQVTATNSGQVISNQIK